MDDGHWTMDNGPTMFDVVGVGTNSVDEVLLLKDGAAAALSSGKARVDERRVMPGGQTATAIAACAQLSLRTSYVGAFGSDQFAHLIRRTLLAHDVDLTNSVECDAPNRTAVILLDADGRRTVLWHRSEGLKISAPDMRAEFLKGRVVHLDDDEPVLALHAARMAHDAGTPVTSDIEHVSETVEQLISAVTYPILEQRLPGQLTGESDPERALRKLRRLNPGTLCITLGERGAAALDGDDFYVAPAFNVKVVDNTGAGDVFRAGFIYGLLQRWLVPDILRFANAAAAVSCTRLGAIPSVPSVEEAQKLIAGSL
jgi:sulfofructose kinase